MMTTDCHLADRRAAGRGLIVALLWILAATTLMQCEIWAQDEPSLGDVARQARAERARAKPEESTPAAQTAKRLTEALGQEHEDAGTPPDGFQAYQGEGYQIWVPSPFSIEGRDDHGILLATADITGVTTRVFAANPVHVTGHMGDIEFNKWARDFWSAYGSITCDKHKPATPEHRCSVGGKLFGYQFRGDARFIEGENRFVPVVCFATAIPDANVDFSKARTAEERRAVADRAIANMGRHSMARRSAELCGAVLDSVRLREEPVNTGPRVVAIKAPMALSAGTTEGQSLGDLARVTRKEAASSTKAKVTVDEEDTISIAPAGFRVRSAMRCAGQCWQETFFLPEKARRVAGGKSDNVYVAMIDDTTSLILYFGTTDVSYGYSEYGMAQDLARRWINAQRDGSKEVHTSRTIDGRRVVIARARLAANLIAWTEEDVAVGTNGVNFSIGCIAREDRFADAESVCSTVFESWRLHQE